MGGVDPENFGVDKKNDVGRNFSVSGVGDVGVWASKILVWVEKSVWVKNILYVALLFIIF